jgi:hypothetical protein
MHSPTRIKIESKKRVSWVRTVFAVERISPDLKEAEPDGGNSIHTHEFDAVIS